GARAGLPAAAHGPDTHSRRDGAAPALPLARGADAERLPDAGPCSLSEDEPQAAAEGNADAPADLDAETLAPTPSEPARTCPKRGQRSWIGPGPADGPNNVTAWGSRTFLALAGGTNLGPPSRRAQRYSPLRWESGAWRLERMSEAGEILQ